jgi:hypothetical protein
MDDTCTRTPDPELGVLFVHGIGQQRSGHTLVSFASALFGWLFRWNCDGPGQLDCAPRLSQTLLRSSPGGKDEPANATLSVPLR